LAEFHETGVNAIGSCHITLTLFFLDGRYQHGCCENNPSAI